MEPHESYTRLLGLALRGGNLVSGSDAVQGAVYAGRVRLLLLSADASPRVCRDAEQWAERGHCLCVALPCDKAELGHALGHGTVAVAALTDTGLANAVGERLAALDPERYAHLSERLQRKVVRAGERRAARARARPNTGTAKPRPDTGTARNADSKKTEAKTSPDKPKARTTPKARPGNAKPHPATGKARANNAKSTPRPRRPKNPDT